ncbi:MAG: MFS transporter [Candidatus Gastranaerophilales bacterium]|nr:MFS transporter [Candidatus Gastranaerophilales bacterium]
MLNNIINYYKAPDVKPVTMNDEEVAKTYRKKRINIFASCFLGYTMFYLTRKNISVALPVLSKELGFSNIELGILGSALYFSYAIGKFVNGVLADKADANKFMTVSIFISAVSNLLFAFSPLVFPSNMYYCGQSVLLLVMSFLWGVNGWFQSAGFPVCTKALTFWWSNKERGTVWSIWATSHQLGTCVVFLLAGYLIPKYGWQSAFIIPAFLNLASCIYIATHMYDKPQTEGLPDIEEYKEGKKPESEKEEDENMSYFEILKKYIFFNPIMWTLVLSFVFVYIFRYGTEDWIIKYLVEFKGDNLEIATQKQTFLPLFGIAGVLLAGLMSDKMYKGRRMPVNIIFCVGLIICLFGLMENYGHGMLHDLIDYVCLSGIGLFTAGPLIFIGGLCAVESSSKKVAAAATGFCGVFGYLGAMLSGIGTGYFIDNFGWQSALWFWIISAFLCIIILYPVYRKGL